MGSTKQRDRPPLEARVCRAIRLLAAGQTVDEVARAIGVRPATVASWQADEDFLRLLACLQDYRRIQHSLDTLDHLMPEAIEALRRALSGSDTAVALQAVREVLDRSGLARRKDGSPGEPPSDQAIRVEYVNPDGQAVSTTPWADRNPAASGPVQGGGVRSPLWEDRDGEDSVDRAGTEG